jgi:hypothetical protein
MICWRIEEQGSRHAEKLCSDAEYCSNHGQVERNTDLITWAAQNLLDSDRVWLNQDPRGYALKIDLKEGERLHTDWGGYGIIAPDLSP